MTTEIEKIALARQMRSEGRFLREIAQALGVCNGTASPFQSYPQLKFEVSNLLTLCKRCHDAFHGAAAAVHTTIGPFLPARKKFEVREQPAIYQYRVAA